MMRTLQSFIKTTNKVGYSMNKQDKTLIIILGLVLIGLLSSCMKTEHIHLDNSCSTYQNDKGDTILDCPNGTSVIPKQDNSPEIETKEPVKPLEGKQGVGIGFNIRQANEEECLNGGHIIMIWSDVSNDNVYDAEIDINVKIIPICNGLDGIDSDDNEKEHKKSKRENYKKHRR